MTEKIRTRTFNHGDKCESSWPSMYGTGGGGRYYWDKESQTFKEGNPPNPNPKLDQAPYYISDAMTPYLHPYTMQVVDSKSQLAKIDEKYGLITTDKKLDPNPAWQAQQERERANDRREAMLKAVAQVDAGTAPLSEETRALCEQRNDAISKALNFDAFNAVGRISNAKGKRYKHRRR